MTDIQRLAKVCVEQHLLFSISPDHLRFSVNAELHANDVFLSDAEVDALISERLGFPIRDVIDAQNSTSECIDDGIDMEPIKRIDISEFRKLGYLQELNRQFLHPLGLALEVIVDDDGNEKFGGVWDYRDDPEGVVYNLKDSDTERVTQFTEKAEYIERERLRFTAFRRSTLGFEVEPIE